MAKLILTKKDAVIFFVLYSFKDCNILSGFYYNSQLIVKQYLIVNHESCNIPFPPEPVCSIRVLNEGNSNYNIQPTYQVLG